MVYKGAQRHLANAIHMPVSVNEVHPFLAAVLAGRAIEIGVGTGIGLVDEANQVILHGGFMLHVEIKLAIHGFELGT